jgi:hypothetical protein
MTHVLSFSTSAAYHPLPPSEVIHRLTPAFEPAFHRHLQANEQACIADNIHVQVDRINAEHKSAFCSVHQRLHGPLRRRLTDHELVWRAEQALAPLSNLGLIPLITLAPRTDRPESRVNGVQRSIAGLLYGLWRKLGFPWAPLGFRSLTLAHDPFGWRKAWATALHTRA